MWSQNPCKPGRPVGLMGQASGLSSPSFLPSQAKRAATGPLDQGQTGGQAGQPWAQGERRTLSTETQPRGQGHNVGDSFGINRHAFLPPTAAKTAQ